MASNHPFLLLFFFFFFSILSFPSLNAAVSQRLTPPVLSPTITTSTATRGGSPSRPTTPGPGPPSPTSASPSSPITSPATATSPTPPLSRPTLSYSPTTCPSPATGWTPGYSTSTRLSSLTSLITRSPASDFNETSFDIWVESASAPALPASLNLYNELKELGFTLFLLTGRDEYARNATVKDLLAAGYSDWKELILRGDSDTGKTATLYKSEKRAELIEEGYRIHGSSGDQWSDLLGFAVAERSFKLPNPMYYIA